MMKLKRYILLGIVLCVCLLMTACQTAKSQQESTTAATSISVEPASLNPKEINESEKATIDILREREKLLQMRINDTPVSVSWEDNEAVEALGELCRNGSLTISMSMYGGFEQVGSIGSYLRQDDVQTTTSAGDIVLYSGDQLVVFYGSNTWAYTRLGHITDKTQQGLKQLLSNGNVTITITI